MCPDLLSSIHLPKRDKKQKGSLLPVAAFVLIGLSVLSIALMRLSTQSGSTVSQEALSLSAFYGAESGAQWGMGVLFLPEVNRTLTDTRCTTTVNGHSISFSAPGLSACTASLSCAVASNATNTTSYYTLVSTGRCAVMGVVGERQIEVSALLRDEA